MFSSLYKGIRSTGCFLSCPDAHLLNQSGLMFVSIDLLPKPLKQAIFVISFQKKFGNWELISLKNLIQFLDPNILTLESCPISGPTMRAIDDLVVFIETYDAPLLNSAKN